MDKRLFVIGVLLLSVFSVKANSLNTNITSDYEFENNFNDEVGGASPANHGGNLTNRNPFAGSFSVNLTATDNYISLPDPNFNNTVAGITVSFWINSTDNSVGQARLIFARGNDSFSSIQITQGQSNSVVSSVAIGFVTGPSGNCQINGIGRINDLLQPAVYHHVVFSYNYTNLSMYTDNVLNSTACTVSFYNAGTTTNYSSIGLSTGGSIRNATIDRFQTWNRALNSSEVADIYNSGVGKQYPFVQSSPVISNANQSTYNPHILNVVNWSTDIVSNSSVNYGTTLDLGSVVSRSENVSTHSLSFPVSSNTTYYVNITSCAFDGVSFACSTSGTFNFTSLYSSPAFVHRISGGYHFFGGIIHWFGGV